jgi:hypothetical protein
VNFIMVACNHRATWFSLRDPIEAAIAAVDACGAHGSCCHTRWLVGANTACCSAAAIAAAVEQLGGVECLTALLLVVVVEGSTAASADGHSRKSLSICPIPKV